MENGWSRKIGVFLNTDESDIIKDLIKMGFNVEQLQINAWHDCIIFLKEELKKLSNLQKEATIIFEYKLENGMRPDVLILTKKNLLVLEFKSGENASVYTRAHRDQVEGYAMRFENYHEYTNRKEINVRRYIVYTHPSININKSGILLKDNFFQVINNEVMAPFSDAEVVNWINSDYEAIPDILEAVDLVFNPKDLPNIMKAKSNIDKVLGSIKNIVEETEKGTLNIILVSGDPGAGKTLLGLKLVKDFIKEFKSNSAAAYLSGNASLVKVLRYQIDEVCNRGNKQIKPYGEAYIKAVHNYIESIIYILKDKKYNRKKLLNKYIQKENILVFDEAQRAWGNERMKKRYKLNTSQSKALLYSLIKSANNNKESKTLICLIGDGQEIYLDEEEGIKNWISALKRLNNSGNMKVYAPSKYKNLLGDIDVSFIENLYLNSYLRGHGADYFPQWIEAVLNNDLNNSKRLLKCIYEEQKHYSIYITKSLKSAQEHLKQRVDKSLHTYGVVTSSFSQYDLKKEEGLVSVPIEDIGNWYSESCREFKQYVTEFDSQGLEIDFPVLYWGQDLIRKNGEWERYETLRCTKEGKTYEGLKSFKDPMQILKNIYRVLLTRGRDGLIIYIPENPLLVETYEFFSNDIGVIEID
ncbi:DUF2075 domain-containing protein [Bacillus paranthracis]|uniref:DNA/RNA helicase domain-containing protein n=1 Tax=Bacillus paranthracis TaxID=2026186 RepID=UPI002FDC79F2